MYGLWLRVGRFGVGTWQKFPYDAFPNQRGTVERRGLGDDKERARALFKGNIYIYISLYTKTVLRNFEYPCGCRSCDNWYLLGTAGRQIVLAVHYSKGAVG